MNLGEWFKMSKPQRTAAIILIILIAAISALRIALSRSTHLPEHTEQRAIELAKFREAIDSAKIDTVKQRTKKKNLANTKPSAK